jgi:2-desacetyl-2-hydroxyethyl bacteriochlorophyllide A dehydrogenase
MKALYFYELGKIKLVEIEKPKLQDSTDVILKVTLTAICGSDIHLINGHIPTTPGYVLGHEYVGIVEQVGSNVHNFKVGDRVVGAGTPFCGECENCKNGHIYRCQNGGIFGSGLEYGNLSGSHAEYMRIPYADNTLIHIPNNLSDEQVLFVGDILATGYHAAKKAEIKSQSNVVVYGAGPVGLCAVASAKLYNPKKIILVDSKNKYRVNLGFKYGATDTILSNETDVIPEIMKLTDGKGADAVIEAVGKDKSIQNAIHSASIGGCISIVGVPGHSVRLPLFEMMMKNLQLQIGLGDLKLMQTLIELIQSDRIDMTGIISHKMPLNDIERAFEIFERRIGHVIKIAIKP